VCELVAGRSYIYMRARISSILNNKAYTILRMASSGMLRRVALIRTDVSEKLSVSFFRVTRIGELETALAVTSNRQMLRCS
jgi:hypothetical protein